MFPFYCIWAVVNKVPSMRASTNMASRAQTDAHARAHKHWREYKDWTLQGHQPTSTTISPTLRGTGPFSSKRKKKNNDNLNTYIQQTFACFE